MAAKKPCLAPFRIAKSNAKKKKHLTWLAMDSGAMTSLQRFRLHAGTKEKDFVERVYESLRGAEEARMRSAREHELINERAVQAAASRKAKIEAGRRDECDRYKEQQERQQQEAMLKRRQEIKWQRVAQARVLDEVNDAIDAKNGNGKAVCGRCNHCFQWTEFTRGNGGGPRTLRRHDNDNGALCPGSNSLHYARAE